jgi:hypothetical protein
MHKSIYYNYNPTTGVKVIQTITVYGTINVLVLVLYIDIVT